jgi:Leucine-rich repeat (LRR) protein
LHHNQLTGSLPLGLGVGSSLPRLTHLDVSYNQLTGRLPPGIASYDSNACALPSAPSVLQFM